VPEGTDHYRRPGWFTKHVFNNLVAGATRLGVSIWGSRVLEVKGRKTGEPRQTPVNLLTIGNETYLVAARGETQWVRNVRAAGGRLDLLLGRRRTGYLATELPDDGKSPSCARISSAGRPRWVCSLPVSARRHLRRM